MAKDDIGTCETCTRAFSYKLIRNGFNDSAFADCDRCGCTAAFSGYYKGVPAAAKLGIYGPVNAEAERLLTSCSCRGSFRANASPRCPIATLRVQPISRVCTLRRTHRAPSEVGSGKGRGLVFVASSLNGSQSKKIGGLLRAPISHRNQISSPKGRQW
jgi:hypothetical protein